MTSLKSKLNFNKLRNKKDKIKNRLKRKDKPRKLFGIEYLLS